MNKKVVLDASALLALLNEEPGHERVAKILSHAVMSSVNVSEVIAVLVSLDIVPIEAENIVLDLIKEIVPFDKEQACLTGLLRTQTKQWGLSLGDRACLSLAKTLHVTAFTADKVWANIKLEKINIEVIR